MNHQQVNSRKSIYKADLFEAFEDRLTLLNGESRVYHSVIRNSAVSVFALDEHDEVYLVDQYRYIHKKRTIEAVAGMIDPKETPLVTAKRELREEAGILAREWKQIFELKAAGSIIMWTQYLFVAKGLEVGTSSPEPSEEIELIKMPLSQAVEHVLRGKIDIAPTTFGILLIDKLKQQGKL